MGRPGDKTVTLTQHALSRALERKITADEIIYALHHGKRVFDLRRYICTYVAKLGGRKRLSVVMDTRSSTIITVFKSKTQKPHWQ